MFIFNTVPSTRRISGYLNKSSLIIFMSFLISQLSITVFSANAAETKPKYWSTVMQENSIGHMKAASKALRGRVITFEPGAVAKFHVHKFPGIRMVIEGSVTVKWKDGNSETYEAGSTFFEGPVGEKPARAHEVSNDGNVVAKIWLVELIPQEKMEN